MEVTGERDIKKSPYYGSTANDIDPMFRVKLQAILNKYITASISSTVNLPKEATEDQISEIYLEAWKQGCKGITVFRDGCREGVLVNEQNDSCERPEKIKIAHAPKRPEILKAHIHQSQIKGERWIFIVGIHNHSRICPYAKYKLAFNNTTIFNYNFVHSCFLAKRTKETSKKHS